MNKGKKSIIGDVDDFVDAALKIHDDDRKRLIELAGKKNLSKNLQRIKACLIDLALSAGDNETDAMAYWPLVGCDEYVIYTEMQYKDNLVILRNRIHIIKREGLEEELHKRGITITN